MLTFCFISNNFLFDNLSFCYCSKFFLPSSLSVIGEDLMNERLGFVVAVLIFLWFFLHRPIVSDMQLFSPSHCVSTSFQFRVLSID